MFDDFEDNGGEEEDSSDAEYADIDVTADDGLFGGTQKDKTSSSEKESIGWFLDGRVNLVFGTHTHVPTADGRILKGGTAYQSDLGMTGPRESVLGREIDACVGRFVDGLPRKCPVAQGDVGIQGCIVEMDAASGATEFYERIEIREDELVSPTSDQT